VQALKRSADEVATSQHSHGGRERQQRQKHVLFDKIKGHFGDVRGKTIALWDWLSSQYDDMREAASRVLMESLWAAGAKVRAYDPVAMPNARESTGSAPISFCARTISSSRGRGRTRHRDRMA